MGLIDFFYNIGIGGLVDDIRCEVANARVESMIASDIASANEETKKYPDRDFYCTASGRMKDTITGTSPASNKFKEEIFIADFLIYRLNEDKVLVKETIQTIHECDMNGKYTDDDVIYVASNNGIDETHINDIIRLSNTIENISCALDKIEQEIGNINDSRKEDVYNRVAQYLNTCNQCQDLYDTKNIKDKTWNMYKENMSLNNERRWYRKK